jgi:hypothetical protein
MELQILFCVLLFFLIELFICIQYIFLAAYVNNILLA